jgi:hypothetical protein
MTPLAVLIAFVNQSMHDRSEPRPAWSDHWRRRLSTAQSWWQPLLGAMVPGMTHERRSV